MSVPCHLLPLIIVAFYGYQVDGTGITGATGATGDIGRPGAPGFPGHKGPMGPNGPPGLMGATGHEGYTGGTGSTGRTGNTGSTGATGPGGSVGPSGPPGPVGSRGSDGHVGNPGRPGGPGAPGPPGPTGEKGENGPQGPAGHRGSPGPTGPTGPTGPRGSPGGPAGPRGRDGEKGETGPQGPPGERGPAGPPGPPGENRTRNVTSSNEAKLDEKLYILVYFSLALSGTCIITLMALLITLFVMCTRERKQETNLNRFLNRHMSTASATTTLSDPYDFVMNQKYESIKPSRKASKVSLGSAPSTSMWSFGKGTVNDAYSGELSANQHNRTEEVSSDGYLEPKPKVFRQRGPSGGPLHQIWKKIGSGRYVTKEGEETPSLTPATGSGPSDALPVEDVTRNSYVEVVEPDDSSTRSNSPVVSPRHAYLKALAKANSGTTGDQPADPRA